MSSYTVLRVEVDSPIVERVLGMTPGVEVVESVDRPASDAESASTDEPETDEPETDSAGGVAERLPEAAETGDGRELVRSYGPLALGVSFVMLGLATIGIWVYRRRSGGAESEAGPDSPAEFDAPTSGRDTTSPAETTTGATERAPVTDEKPTARDEEPTDTDDDASLSIVRPEAEEDSDAEDDVDEDTDEVGAETEPAGRTEDREEVEWTTKWDSDAGPSEAEDAEDESVDEADTDEPAPGDSVDVAPLLGVAFVAVSGAVVRWLRDDEE